MFRLKNCVNLKKSQNNLIFQVASNLSLSTNNILKQVIKENCVTKCIDSSNVKFTHNLGRCTHRFSCNPPLRRHLQVTPDRPSSKTCWSCNQILKNDTLFCHSCSSLQPVDKQTNLFNVLGIQLSYNLNQSELKNKFHKLQSLLHPDKFSSKPKKEQEFSEEFSSIVNKAYSTLLDPLERGLYLLSLNNISIEEGKTDMDKMFLMEIMERNEEIENESDPKKLNEFYQVNREQLKLLIRKVAQAFDNNDIELAKKLLTEMKYYNTIDKKIMEIKQKLNIPD